MSDDFEVMPVGTRAEMEKARNFLREAADKANSQRGKLYRTCAVNLFRLLEQPGVDRA